MLDVLYTHLVKPILFQCDAELVHDSITTVGEWMGKSPIFRSAIEKKFGYHDPILTQKLCKIPFHSPIGLSAGFDYEAKLYNITPSLGFGFQTVGTVSYKPYKGNLKPRLARLPQSKSLLVNKGFKNLGAITTAKKLEGKVFRIPLGISIGRTNDPYLGQEASIADIMHAFTVFEDSHIQNAYYELNISCPNLLGNVTFYTPKNLEALLTHIDTLQLTKPVFMKMPITLPNNQFIKLLDVIGEHCPKGVIIGNLQQNRHEPSLVQKEVEKFPIGNFSGKPTFIRSNELIRLAYTHVGKRLCIIGCGGVFCAEDAYEKIKCGASLVQLITGLIYQGPQLIAQINKELALLLKKDGYTHISQSIGSSRI